MKVLSVLFTITLLVSTNRLAGILRRLHALPERSTMIRSISLRSDRKP
jgi:hypothetical protein